MWEEQPGGLCGWSRVGEGEGGRTGGRRGDGHRSPRALGGRGENLGFYPGGGGRSPGGTRLRCRPVHVRDALVISEYISVLRSVRTGLGGTRGGQIKNTSVSQKHRPVTDAPAGTRRCPWLAPTPGTGSSQAPCFPPPAEIHTAVGRRGPCPPASWLLVTPRRSSVLLRVVRTGALTHE